MHYATRTLFAGSWLVCCIHAAAQTIGDFSRSQRAVIEAEIAKNNAKVLSAASQAPLPLRPPLPLPQMPSGSVFPNASANVPANAVPPPAGSAGASPAELPGRDASKGPQWTVSGVFLSAARELAEVVVDGSPYLLTVGEQVPGTRWKVDSIAVNRVVMAMDPGKGKGKGKAVPVRRVVNLAEGALR